jgi:putative FmdB family regulatory protein
VPTYEYRCPKGHDFERFYKTISSASSASSEVRCPECGEIAERRLSAGGGLLFKGSGFYLTDYGKNAHRGSAPETGKADTKSETKSDASAPKTETKSENAKPAETKPSTPAKKSTPKSE